MIAGLLKFIGGVILLLFTVSMCSTILTSPKNYNAPQGPIISAESTPAKPIIHVLAWNWRHDGDYIYVEGAVKNISDHALNYVEAVVEFKDNKKAFVHSESAHLKLTNLLPGQTSPFEMMVRENHRYIYANLRLVQQGKELDGGQ